MSTKIRPQKDSLFRSVSWSKIVKDGVVLPATNATKEDLIDWIYWHSELLSDMREYWHEQYGAADYEVPQDLELY